MKEVIGLKSKEEQVFEDLEERIIFSYWDKESDVEGVITLRPSLIEEHKQVVLEADALIDALTKQKKQGVQSERESALFEFTNNKKQESARLIEEYSGSILPFKQAVRPVIEYDLEGRSLSFTDIYEETKHIKDDAEALEYWKNKRLTERMEHELTEEFFGVSLANMLIQMREDFERIRVWMNQAKRSNPQLPDLPEIKSLSEDTNVEKLYERLVFAGLKEIKDLPAEKLTVIENRFTDWENKGYITKGKIKKYTKQK